jgi:hypothetical protein
MLQTDYDKIVVDLAKINIHLNVRQNVEEILSILKPYNPAADRGGLTQIELLLSDPQIDALKARTRTAGEPETDYPLMAQVILNEALADEIP